MTRKITKNKRQKEVLKIRRIQGKNRWTFALPLFCLAVIFLSLLGAACESPSLKANQTAANQAPANEISPFESDLQTMRTANFDFIYVFRRKDGGVFDSEDKKYLRANSPRETNRFILTDDGKAFIAGSSYKFALQNLEALANRFNVEDYSAKKEETKYQPGEANTSPANRTPQ